MATVTGNIVVSASQCEVSHVVERLDIPERFGGMTRFALGSKLALMNSRFWMATETVRFHGLELHVRMTIRTLHVQMGTIQFKSTHSIVVKNVGARFRMALFTTVPKATFVRIVFAMAWSRTAVGRCIGIVTLGMTINAFGTTAMQPFKGPLGVVVVIKPGGWFKNPRVVTLVTCAS